MIISTQGKCEDLVLLGAKKKSGLIVVNSYQEISWLGILGKNFLQFKQIEKFKTKGLSSKNIKAGKSQATITALMCFGYRIITLWLLRRFKKAKF